jgi:hypothetical protein
MDVVANPSGTSVELCGTAVAERMRQVKKQFGSFACVGVEDFMKNFASGRCVVPPRRAVWLARRL